MDEEKTQEQGFSKYLSFLPFILGFLGVVFVGIGLYLTFNKNEKPKITISEVQGEATDSGKIVVDVEGAVERPGVYEVGTDARYRDGLAAAGGLSSEADREYVAKYVNLAAKISDGAKIFIPKAGEQIQGAQANNLTSQSPNSDFININTASLSELDTLSGVGPATAQKIVDGRPYGKPEDLIEKKIVGNSVWEKIKEKVAIY